ncbi:MAG: hypothetical protein M5U14_14750 [Acidimicrobiia bacterium]|nr:hypothetical protein [Acidimicrobiia bacterium]
MERIESSHSTWIFDPERMRFRRVPKGVDPDVPSLERDWERYYGLEIDATTGSFTVTLNPEGTRLLRSWREGTPSHDEEPTAELTLEPVDRPDGC